MKAGPFKRTRFLSLSILFFLVSSVNSFSQSCDTWVAIGNSTSDRPSPESQPLVYHPRYTYGSGEMVKCTHIEIPQVEETYAHMGSKIWWTFGYEHGLNEWGARMM
jgi:hypothetical protein